MEDEMIRTEPAAELPAEEAPAAAAAPENEAAELPEEAEQAPDPAAAEALRAAWQEQADRTRQAYPGFDLQKELEDPVFTRQLLAGVDMRAAYVAAHEEEILSAAMAYAAGRTEKRIAGSIAAGLSRPAENGRRSTARAAAPDIGSLSRAEFQALERRVAAGERISF